MINENIVALAENYMSLHKDTSESMHDYFQVDDLEAFERAVESKKATLEKLEERISDRRPAWLLEDIKSLQDRISSPKRMYPKAPNYPQLIKILMDRKEPFLLWLDRQPHYVQALSELENKELFWPYSLSLETTQNGELMSLRNHFDAYVASAIIFWSNIQKNGVDHYLTPKKTEVDKIAKKAEELLSAIENAGLSVQEKIPRTTLIGLNNLKDRKGLGRISLDSPADDLIAIKKTHEKSARELLIRFMCMRYGLTFGSWKKVSKQKHPASNLKNSPSARFDHTKDKECVNNDSSESTHYWTKNLDDEAVSTIHADSVAEIVTMITGDYDTTARKIYDIAKKQKEHIIDNKLSRRAAYSIYRT